MSSPETAVKVKNAPFLPDLHLRTLSPGFSRPRTWLLKQDEKTCYWGFITISGGAIIVHGDCGSLVVTNGFRSNEEAFNWAKRRHEGDEPYLAEKSNSNTLFSDVKAKEFIKEELKDGTITPRKAEHLRDALSDGYMVFWDALQDEGYDLCDVHLMDYPSDTYYCIGQVLQWAKAMRDGGVEWDEREEASA